MKQKKYWLYGAIISVLVTLAFFLIMHLLREYCLPEIVPDFFMGNACLDRVHILTIPLSNFFMFIDFIYHLISLSSDYDYFKRIGDTVVVVISHNIYPLHMITIWLSNLLLGTFVGWAYGKIHKQAE